MWSSSSTSSMSCSSSCDPSTVAVSVQPCSSLQLDSSVAQVQSLQWESQQPQETTAQRRPPLPNVVPWLPQNSNLPAADAWPRTNWIQGDLPPALDYSVRASMQVGTTTSQGQSHPTSSSEAAAPVAATAVSSAAALQRLLLSNSKHSPQATAPISQSRRHASSASPSTHGPYSTSATDSHPSFNTETVSGKSHQPRHPPRPDPALPVAGSRPRSQPSPARAASEWLSPGSDNRAQGHLNDSVSSQQQPSVNPAYLLGMQVPGSSGRLGRHNMPSARTSALVPASPDPTAPVSLRSSGSPILIRSRQESAGSSNSSTPLPAQRNSPAWVQEEGALGHTSATPLSTRQLFPYMGCDGAGSSDGNPRAVSSPPLHATVSGASSRELPRSRLFTSCSLQSSLRPAARSAGTATQNTRHPSIITPPPSAQSPRADSDRVFRFSYPGDATRSKPHAPRPRTSQFHHVPVRDNFEHTISRTSDEPLPQPYSDASSVEAAAVSEVPIDHDHTQSSVYKVYVPISLHSTPAPVHLCYHAEGTAPEQHWTVPLLRVHTANRQWLCASIPVSSVRRLMKRSKSQRGPSSDQDTGVSDQQVSLSDRGLDGDLHIRVRLGHADANTPSTDVLEPGQHSGHTQARPGSPRQQMSRAGSKSLAGLSRFDTSSSDSSSPAAIFPELSAWTVLHSPGCYLLEGSTATRVLQKQLLLVLDATAASCERVLAMQPASLELKQTWHSSQKLQSSLLVYTSCL